MITSTIAAYATKFSIGILIGIAVGIAHFGVPGIFRK